MRSQKCTCITIMNDPTRHFKECPDRRELLPGTQKIGEILAQYPESMTRWKEQRKAALTLLSKIERAQKILIDGLEYHEHDGHDMPKKVARNALEALGIPRGEQPW